MDGLIVVSFPDHLAVHSPMLHLRPVTSILPLKIIFAVYNYINSPALRSVLFASTNFSELGI